MLNQDIDNSDADSFKSAEDGEPGVGNTSPQPIHPSPTTATDTSADYPPEDEQMSPEIPRFSPEEEAALLETSNHQKSNGNALFVTSNYGDAIQMYEQSLASCPNYLEYEIAVLKANIAACHLKLAEWKIAIDAATAAVDALERLDPSALSKKPENGESVSEQKGTNDNGFVEEIDDSTADKIEALARSGRSHDDVMRIRGKALMRRASAREQLGGWANLAGAEEDYKYLSSMSTLPPLDRQTVNKALLRLPPLLDKAKQNEMAEMMGKLKDLGNGILKPFGLSTDNFQFVKDEKTGGYSMNFNQGAGR